MTFLRRGPRRSAGALAAFTLLFLTLACLFASGHGVGSSQLRLRVAGPEVDGEWELPVADARGLFDHEAPLRAYLASHLSLVGDGRPCPVRIGTEPLEQDTASDQVIVHLAATCPTEPARLEVRCNLLFDRDPAHRAYYSIQDARITHVGRFRVDDRSVVIDIRHFRFWGAVTEFLREGVGHVLSGVDHVLFLVALLLAAPLTRREGAWGPGRGLLVTAREVFKVVTAFTVAHSLTLCLSFWGVITPPSRWIEVGIAVSVFAAAWNNIRPFLPGRAWLVALGFGLVHGLGFAGALKNLALPIRARGLALGAFNAGVEVGQLLIVATALPLLVAAAKRPWYPRAVMGGASLVIAWLAVMWTLERAFGWSLFALRA